jgi:NDP-sugar pyrophosphorylase family protein
MQAVILAGGTGTRMLPETHSIPKSMLPVAGRPFIAWQLPRLVQAGFSRALICVGHLGEAIRDYVGRGSEFGIEVAYSEDGPRLLGTAGALRRALVGLEDSFLVTYGDSYLPFDYAAPLRDLLVHPEALGTMTVHRNRGRWDTSNTAVEGDRVIRYAKATGSPELEYIDYGAIALRRTAVAEIPPDEPWGLDQVQADLARRGVLRAHLAHERFFEIGSPAGRRDLERHLGEGM